MSSFVFQSAQVQSIAREIEALGEEIKQILDSNLTNEMINLQDAWKSNAATAYNNQFQEIKSKFQMFYNSIREMSESINAVSNALNQTDEANNIGVGV